MKINYWMIGFLISCFVIGYSVRWITHSCPEVKTIEVPIVLNIDSAKAEWIEPITKKLKIREMDVYSRDRVIARLIGKIKQGSNDADITSIYDSLSNLPVSCYSIDTALTVDVDMTYKDQDSLDIKESSKTDVRLAATFIGEPVNIFSYVTGSLSPIKMNMRIREREKIVYKDSETFWIMPTAGIGEFFYAGTMIGYKQFGIGGLFSKTSPIWTAGYKIGF